MKRDMVQWLEQIKQAEVKKAIPVLSFPGIQLIGINVPTLINDSDMQSKCIKAVADRCDTAAAVSLMDLSVEAEAFGATIKTSVDEVPTVIGMVVDTEEDAKNLRIPKVGEKRTGIYIESMKKAVKSITDRPVFAGVIGPFSLAGRLMDMTEIMVKCYTEPEVVHMVLEKVAEFSIEYIKAYKETGSNGYVMAEPAAGLLSLEMNEKFSTAYVKRIINETQDENFIVIYHNCGNSVPLVESLVSNGANAYHFGDAINMQEILEKMPRDTVVMGNISPSKQFRNGTPQSIYENTTDTMKQCGSYSNYIISSGCDIPAMSPWENIDSFFKAAKDYYTNSN